MSDVECFLLEPTDLQRLWRRRYSSGNGCPVGDYHNAMLLIGDEPIRWRGEGNDRCMEATRVEDYPGEWPETCACGYHFTESDQRQVFSCQLYRMPSGRLVLNRAIGGDRSDTAPAGAMWDAWWMSGWKGPDGRSLCVMLPDGREWLIDGPSNNGPGWKRTGEPPRITASPSILTPGYHGWLRDGRLIAC